MSDSYYSGLSEKKLPRKDILVSRKNRALECKKNGFDQVWLCIDGSNDDCSCTSVEIAEKGYIKSETDKDFISFTDAVTQTWYPIIFEVFQGGLVDYKDMKPIVSSLRECGIQVKGVILDRGCCNSVVLECLNEEKLQYVIMAEGKPQGVEVIAAEYSEPSAVIRNA